MPNTTSQIHKPISRMACGDGLRFMDDVPYLEDVFPILNPNNPKSIIGFVHIAIHPNEYREAECQITYLHTAPQKGMVRDKEYKQSPVTHISEPANFLTGVTPVKTVSRIHSIFQDMVMGGQYLFGYPLSKNKLDYLIDPKEHIEAHFDEIIGGLALHAEDYLKSGSDINDDRENYLYQLRDVLDDVELQDFIYEIYLPEGLLMGIDSDYCVMPRSTPSNPFANPTYDQYSQDIPIPIEQKFQHAILNARQKYGLEIEAVLASKQKQPIKQTL